MSDNYILMNDDCLAALKELPDNSVDSLITDPPAAIGFMGKAWDDDKGGRKQWIQWLSQIMIEVKRVLKPGAHGLVWAIPRTSHWTATALEDAGFEIRDVTTHVFGSGFPKSLNISKAIDKAAGAASPEAKQWQGWGTALKPASEHWILVRKPLEENTVAANVLKHGTGGINIEKSRIGSGESKRFPSNLLLSHNDDCDAECTPGCAVADLDRQSGVTRSTGGGMKNADKYSGGYSPPKSQTIGLGDTGGASRFFYCAKPSKREKNLGTEDKNIHPTVKSTKLMSYLINMITPPGGVVLDPFLGSGTTGVSALENNFIFIGIEKELEYFKIAKARISYVKKK